MTASISRKPEFELRSFVCMAEVSLEMERVGSKPVYAFKGVELQPEQALQVMDQAVWRVHAWAGVMDRNDSAGFID